MSLVNTLEGANRLNYLTSVGVSFRMTHLLLWVPLNALTGSPQAIIGLQITSSVETDISRCLNLSMNPALVFLNVCCVKIVLRCNDAVSSHAKPNLLFSPLLHRYKVPCRKPQWTILQNREVQWIPRQWLGLVYMAWDVVLTKILGHENQGSVLC